MSRSCQDKFSPRHELVRHALPNGIRACARQFGCSRNTVREWLRRWRAGDHSLADRSRRPLNQPARTKPTLEKLVIAARKKTPCFGARRLVEAFDLPVGKGAAHRILRDAGLVRKRPRKHKRKADLRAFKAKHAPLTRLQMDTKYITDIPHYWPQMQAQRLPRFQYTIRCESTGAMFVSYSSEIRPRAPTATPTSKVSTPPSKTSSSIWKTFRAAHTS